MKNKLHLLQKTARLTCIWVPTGDAKRPLACLWVGAQTPQTSIVTPSNDEFGRMHLCA